MIRLCPQRFLNCKHLIEWEVRQSPDDPHPELNYLAAGSVRVVHHPAYTPGNTCGGAGGGGGYQAARVETYPDWRKVVCVSYHDATTLMADIEQDMRGGYNAIS